MSASSPPTAATPVAQPQTVELGSWLFRRDLNRLVGRESSVQLEPMVARLLAFLVARRGRVATKKELLRAVWEREFVADSALTRAIAELRRALGDDAQRPQYIETIPKRGYRLLAEPSQRSGRASLLRRQAVWAALVSTFFVAGGYALSRGVLPRGERPALAVLPLKNLSQEAEGEVFAAGMTEALITSLARTRAFRVTSRRSVEPFGGPKSTLAEIAEALDADAIVEGSVLTAGDRVRITVQLTHVGTGGHVWASSYEGELSDVLSLQSRVARAIVGEIRRTLGVDEAVAQADRPAVSPEAYRSYLKGRFHLRRCGEAAAYEAIDDFEDALTLDPGFAAPYAGLAICYVRMAESGIAPAAETLTRAHAAALAALELDPDAAEAHLALASVRFLHDRDWNGAQASFLQALRLNPSDAAAHLRYAVFLASLGRFEEAIAIGARALELDPMSPDSRQTMAWVFLRTGRYGDALAEMKRAEGLAGSEHRYTAWSLALLGRYEMAEERLERLVERQEEGGDDLDWATLAWTRARLGRAPEARRIAARLESRNRPDPYALAVVYAGLGEPDEAFGWLERAVRTGSLDAVHFKVEPFLEPLRGDARFAELVAAARVDTGGQLVPVSWRSATPSAASARSYSA